MGRKPAELALIPDMHWLVDPALTAVKGMFHIRSHYLPALDNLLDDSHLSFVHRKSIGTPKIVKASIEIDSGDDWVGFSRWTLDTPPSAMHSPVRWAPRFDLHAISELVASTGDVRTPLARAVGSKEYQGSSYHRSVFQPASSEVQPLPRKIVDSSSRWT